MSLLYTYQLAIVILGAASSLDSENYDVDAYFRKQPAVIPHCDQRTQLKRRGKTRGTCIHITETGAIVHARDLRNEPGSGKQMLMDMMLRGVLADVGESLKCRVSFLMVYTASGPVRDEKFPVLGFGKRDPEKQPGLLVPNPFFVAPRWWDELTEASLQKSANRPWRWRSNRVMFRGACGPGAQARFQLLRMRDPEDRLDVGFTKVDGYGTMADCISGLAAKTNSTRADVDLVMRRLKPHVPQSNFSNYRYLLHMPGSATGSYSRNLQYLWAHGAVVLIWKHAATEWYYQHLRDGVHYLSVDENNLYNTLRRLDGDARLQLALRRAGRRFAFQHLSGKSLVARWNSIFGVLQERQTSRNSYVPNATSCTCNAYLLRAKTYPPCQKCEITLKRGRSISKFVGLVQ
ncbi:hypothetical protein CTAYLR_005452 [Chrysophaeum taylorii]|uniref:Glycosyl transferase CAP10 domain-containing protein n=1 Tax=Chrysophaeum taylorii TaxID=2483200 RepID=A0AAD7UJT6_9STRA|nr:hypothetical protein CTAYLR_005452 [Chrysophaeum taylorii]